MGKNPLETISIVSDILQIADFYVLRILRTFMYYKFRFLTIAKACSLYDLTMASIGLTNGSAEAIT